MLFMMIEKDTLPSLPAGIQNYVKEYFVVRNTFGRDVYCAFIDPDFPVTVACVPGRAPISSTAVDSIFSEGLQEVRLSAWVRNQLQSPRKGIELFKP